MSITVQASEFKNKCLQFLNEVRRGDTYLITKLGVPFAQVTAVNPEQKKLFGAMKNSFVEKGDIMASLNESWEAEHA